MSKIALLIPCYNEAPTIAKVIDEAREFIPEAAIYVFDNNSTDGTGDIARSKGVTVIKEPRQGKGNVVEAMLAKVEADCYIMVDGDDTYDLSSAREMAHLVLDEHVDMVVGDRLAGDYYTENKRPFHGLGNAVVTFLVRILFGKGIKDVMTGYRAFSTRFAKSFKPRTHGFEIETELSIFALYRKMKISTLTIGYRDRPAGCVSKLNTYRDGIKILWLIARCFFRLRPFAAMSLLAALSFLVSAVLLLVGFLAVPATPVIMTGFVFLALSILLLSSGIFLDAFKKD